MSNVSTQPKLISSDFHITKIIKAFGLMSSATILAILFSTISTKILSLVGGTSGMALMGIFRNFGALLTGVLTLGFNNVVMHEVSVSTTEEKLGDVINASVLLFFIQLAISLVIATLFGTGIAKLVLGHSPTGSDVLCIQIVFAMALVNIALQNTTAILRGQSQLKLLIRIQVLTAASTLAMIYPLAKMGDIGFAINVASGGVVSTPIAIIYIIKRNAVKFSLKQMASGYQLLKRTFFSSVLITLQAVFTLGALLGSQSLINRAYGNDPLGNYNAALLVIDTGILILMSSMRPYFLPELGKARTEIEKHELCKKITSITLFLGISGALVLLLASDLVTLILFSSSFKLAAQMLATFSLSIVGLVLMWTYNTFLIHLGKHGQYAFIDSVWALLILGGTFLVCHFHLPVKVIPYSYVVACNVSGFSYAFFVARKYGRGYLSPVNLLFSSAGLLFLAAVLYLKLS